MPLSRSRDYLSIGEVLDAIRTDFPDVSISKIRFLEAEGLIQPERTKSGYRKFYDDDLERLRYILSLQRDHFMPLKVIRERLQGANGDASPPAQTAPPQAPPAASPESNEVPVDIADLSLGVDELKQMSGLTVDELKGLQEFGLIPSDPDRAFTGDDLAVAKAAHGMFEFGVEPRHLRMYRQTVDREVSFHEQIVSPMTRRRDDAAGQQAAQSMSRLVGLSRQMREALLRSALRDLT